MIYTLTQRVICSHLSAMAWQHTEKPYRSEPFTLTKTAESFAIVTPVSLHAANVRC